MKELNLVDFLKKKEQNDVEELSRHQMNRTNGGRPLALSACIDFCYVTGDMFGEIMYFTS